VSPGTGTVDRLLQGFGIDVADIHQLGLVGVLFQCAKMVGGNPAATHQCKADFAIFRDFYIA
jgi:hypothetical protein